MLKKDTGKFWSFKDTTNYKNMKFIPEYSDVIRTFIFKKSYLLEIKIENNNLLPETMYVIPLKYTSHSFPGGFYKGIGNNKNTVIFDDNDIVKVI